MWSTRELTELSVYYNSRTTHCCFQVFQLWWRQNRVIYCINSCYDGDVTNTSYSLLLFIIINYTTYIAPYVTQTIWRLTLLSSSCDQIVFAFHGYIRGDETSTWSNSVSAYVITVVTTTSSRLCMHRCYNCGELTNHIAVRCPQGPLEKRCHRCKSEDHLVIDCPLGHQFAGQARQSIDRSCQSAVDLGRQNDDQADHQPSDPTRPFGPSTKPDPTKTTTISREIAPTAGSSPSICRPDDYVTMTDTTWEPRQPRRPSRRTPGRCPCLPINGDVARESPVYLSATAATVRPSTRGTTNAITWTRVRRPTRRSNRRPTSARVVRSRAK